MEVIQSLAFIAVVLIIFFIALYFIPLGHWFAATISGVRISLMELLLMRLRRSPVKEIVEGLIVSTKGGLNLSRDQLEAFALSGGNINNVVNGRWQLNALVFHFHFKMQLKQTHKDSTL